MFPDNSITKLIIVCTEKTRKYGTYLMQLISSINDKDNLVIGLKDGSVVAVLWSEKDYKANLPTLPSSSYVLFIGDSKLITTESACMQAPFNKYGMHFASLGTRAAIHVDKKILKISEYTEFIAMVSKYEKKFEIFKNFINTENALIKWSFFITVIDPVEYRKARAIINDQQYTFLTLFTYREMLSDFLKG